MTSTFGGAITPLALSCANTTPEPADKRNNPSRDPREVYALFCSSNVFLNASDLSDRLSSRCIEKTRQHLVALTAAGRGTRDQYGSVGRTEAVIYVDDSDVGGARVEHAEEGCGAVKAGSVADRGGDGDDRDADEATDDAGERAFHAGTDDDRIGLGELIADCQNAVEACYAYVVEARDLCVEEFGGDGGFFCGWLVAGACGEDGYVALRFYVGRLLQGDGAGLRVVVGCWSGLLDCGECDFAGPGG